MPTTETANRAPRARALKGLRTMIREGAFTEGSALPPERELSSRLGMSRGPVRWALGALEQEGLIRRYGARTKLVVPVAEVSPPGGAAGMGRCLAVLSPTISPGEDDNLSLGWADRIAYGASRAAVQRHFSALAVGQGQLSDADIDLLLDLRPAGVVVPELHASADPPLAPLQRLQGAGLAVVVYSGRDDLDPFDQVISDHEEGAYLLTRHLIGLGRRHIVLYWAESVRRYWFAPRQRGYRRAMQEAGLAPRVVPVHHELRVAGELREQFDAATRYHIGSLLPLVGPDADEPVDALLLNSDGSVPPVAAALRALGRAPERDVVIGGYDNYWAGMPERRWSPVGPVATIDKRNLAIGRTLIELLVDRVEGRLGEGAVHRKVAPVIVPIEPEPVAP